jgi:hypothetical protein
MGKQKPPTYSEIIRDLLSVVNQPISINELIDKFLKVRVPQTKNPRSSVRDKIREEKGRLLVFVEDDHILPIDIAYHNAQFRLKITKKMLVKRIIPLDEFGYYFIGKLPNSTMNLLLHKTN